MGPSAVGARARGRARSPGRRAAGWGSGAGWPGRARAAAAATRCCQALGCTWTPWSRRPLTSSAPRPFWRPPHPWRWPRAPVCGTWPGDSGTRPVGTGASHLGPQGAGEISAPEGPGQHGHQPSERASSARHHAASLSPCTCPFFLSLRASPCGLLTANPAGGDSAVALVLILPPSPLQELRQNLPGGPALAQGGLGR